MAEKQQVIGVYGFAMQEILHRPFLGVLRYCEENGGFSTRDFRTLDVIDHDGKVLTPAWKGRCDGIVVSTARGPNMNDAQVADWVLSAGVPAVSVTGDWKDARIVSVHTDQRSAGTLAAKHLEECGCQSFLYVGFSKSIGSKWRSEAFCEALKSRGREVRSYSTSVQPLGTGEDEEMMRRERDLIDMLRKLPRPLGIWTVNDSYASAVCRTCLRMPVNIPDEVKILGTDDTSLARTNMPTLSSIRTPGETIGYLAMKALHRLLTGKRAVGAEVPAEDLVVRESTAGGRNGVGTMDAALEYIARHACTGVTVEHVAQTLGISRRSFVDQFQRHVGRLPSEEIQRVRLEHAQRLLRHEKVSVSRIAGMVGFMETAAFSKFFTKHMGMSPREFRQKQG